MADYSAPMYERSAQQRQDFAQKRRASQERSSQAAKAQRTFMENISVHYERFKAVWVQPEAERLGITDSQLIDQLLAKVIGGEKAMLKTPEEENQDRILCEAMGISYEPQQTDDPLAYIDRAFTNPNEATVQPLYKPGEAYWASDSDV